MSATARPLRELPDVQASPDRRGIAIDLAGVDGLRLPAVVEDVDQISISTIINVSAAVSVSTTERGTHMSRLIDEFLRLNGQLKLAAMPDLYHRILKRSSADAGRIRVEFPWFVEKTAPVSKQHSPLDLSASYTVAESRQGALQVSQQLRVPITTLCPCSKAISRFGAHNQRADVQIELIVSSPLAIGRVTELVERHASCEIYGLLKRVDEKYVTEKAYENPRFVEDVVREVYSALNEEPSVVKARVHVASHESIHNHQAFALIDDWGDRRAQ